MLIMCLSIGLTLSDFRRLKVGTILDILIEKINQIDKKDNKGEGVRIATSNDDITSFF